MCGSAYLLSQTTFMPIFGKLYTFFSIKLVWVVSLVVYEIGSIGCATAPTSVPRIGSSSILSSGMTIIGLTIPLTRRPPYLAIVSSMIGVSNVVAPLVGGVFTDSPTLTWRFCFWIDLRKSTRRVLLQNVGLMPLTLPLALWPLLSLSFSSRNRNCGTRIEH